MTRRSKEDTYLCLVPEASLGSASRHHIYVQETSRFSLRQGGIKAVFREELEVIGEFAYFRSGVAKGTVKDFGD